MKKVIKTFLVLAALGAAVAAVYKFIFEGSLECCLCGDDDFCDFDLDDDCSCSEDACCQ